MWIHNHILYRPTGTHEKSRQRPLILDFYSALQHYSHVTLHDLSSCWFVCLFGLNVSFQTSEVISRQCLLVAVVLLNIVLEHLNTIPKKQDTWHPTLPLYTDTGPTYCWAIYWCTMVCPLHTLTICKRFERLSGLRAWLFGLANKWLVFSHMAGAWNIAQLQLRTIWSHHRKCVWVNLKWPKTLGNMYRFLDKRWPDDIASMLIRHYTVSNNYLF